MLWPVTKRGMHEVVVAEMLLSQERESTSFPERGGISEAAKQEAKHQINSEAVPCVHRACNIEASKEAQGRPMCYPAQAQRGRAWLLGLSVSHPVSG